ncbi:hypothetical protein [Alteromonas lipotrueiana]|uniref:hypothetical protein n=1 Tax=Alteromonas lipotrueiana TaxID=2803815 RepID=UPI001C47300B|nr:hypothetical protein [Alteromonas lipotrueiana]|tara:strand:+ start:447 stop:683 length:237 start_codon:yes stop_codon:yes gene_type:complete
MNLTAIAIVAIVSGVIYKIIEAGCQVSKNKSASQSTLKEYQSEIAELRERIEVLEKIVTDESYELKKKFKDLDNDKVA